MLYERRLSDSSGNFIFTSKNGSYWCKTYSPIKNVCRRLSKYSCKKVVNGIRSLIKKQLILPYQTHHSKDIRLNPKKMDLIKEMTESKWNKLNDF